MDEKEEMLYREMNEEDDFYMGDREKKNNKQYENNKHYNSGSFDGPVRSL